METKTDPAYILTFHRLSDRWFGFEDGFRHDSCIWVETIEAINPIQHMITKECVCGGLIKMVSKA